MSYLTAIPIFNEERHLEGVLREVRRYSPNILIINDGSTDHTADLLAAQKDLTVITHPTNRGYGAALISAFDHVKQHPEFDVLVTMDCDGQHEPARIAVLLEAMDDADIVSGSRYLRDFHQDTEAPQDRRRINFQITKELNARHGLHLTDAFPQCDTRLHSGCALAWINLDSFHAGEIDDEPVIAGAMSGVTMSPASYRHDKLLTTRKLDTAKNVSNIDTLGDSRRVCIDHAIPNFAGAGIVIVPRHYQFTMQVNL